MAKRTFGAYNLTWTPQTLNLALTSSTYMALQPVSAATIVDIDEIMISGLASASTIGSFMARQISTVATTPTALAAPNADGVMGQNSTPTVQTTYVAAATGPIAANTTGAPSLNLALNMFGGIVRWNAAPTQQWTCVGSSAPCGVVLINSTVAGGAAGSASAHFIYEPY